MRKELIAHKDPKSPISEIFRTLRTNIQFMNTSKKMQTLLVSSTLPGEGKSWVASNLAVTFAQAGKKVILIDADMRKGRQYVIFGGIPKPGLSNCLSEIEIEGNRNLSEDIIDYIQETEVENLYLMPAGSVPPNPSELLVSTKMIQLLDELKNICDIIIIDGTPCELVTDSVILSRIVDSTIIVTAHNYTKKDALERVIKNIQNVGGKLAGVVLNKVPVSTKKYEERYYYYGKNPDSSHKKKKLQKKTNSSNDIKIKPSSDTKVEEENLQKIAKTIDIDTKGKKAQKSTKPVNLNENELPKAMSSNKEKLEANSKEIQIDRTNDILKQINQYLDEEKKK